MNVSELLPHTSTEFDYLKSRKAGVSDITFAGVTREFTSMLNGYPSSSASDRTSKVARITELSQTIQSRLRGPMHELERHLECEHTSYCQLGVVGNTS